MRKIFKNPHTRVFLSFSAIQAMQIVLPLLAFPWLGRMLGPEPFGLLMYMCVIPPIICLLMEWGLTAGAARSAARSRYSSASLANLLGEVFSAKIILACACLCASALCLPAVPHAPEYPRAYFMAIALGVCRGITPLWFFQGIGSGVKRLAVWDVCSSLAILALVFFFIREPENWELYLLFSAAIKGGTYLYLNFSLWKQYEPAIRISSGLDILRQTRTLFASSFLAAVYNNGVQLLLGYFLAPAQMGIMVAVNKMLRALASLVNPFTQTIFPEICILRDFSPERARRILRFSLATMFAMMFLASLLVCALAPFLINIALGSEYAAAVPVLRVMIFASPFMAVDYVLGMQTLVAFGQENAQVKVQAIVACASLPLAASIACGFGLNGAAWIPAIVEAGLAAGYIIAVAQNCPGAFFD